MVRAVWQRFRRGRRMHTVPRHLRAFARERNEIVLDLDTLLRMDGRRVHA